MSDEEYAYEVINSESDAHECAQLIAEEYTTHNPITRFDRVTSRCFFYACSYPSLNRVLHEGLSLLVRHRPSEKIVGAIVAGDLYSLHKNNPYDPSSRPAIIPVNDLLAEMDDLFIRRHFGRELRPNLVLHVTIGATRAEHSGKGVASRLRSAVCEHAQQTKGFQYALVHSTNQATQHIYVDKMGGQQMIVVDPTQWLWKNQHDGLSRPYEHYQNGTIQNIVINLPLHQLEKNSSSTLVSFNKTNNTFSSGQLLFF